jgi:EAL domain-containing protein (putative c-di-GMP-specific phosphodiesterase class I)
MCVIAEGVETIEQHNFLNNSDVEELQGFYFGRPTTASEMNKMLAKCKTQLS